MSIFEQVLLDGSFNSSSFFHTDLLFGDDSTVENKYYNISNSQCKRLVLQAFKNQAKSIVGQSKIIPNQDKNETRAK